MIKSVLAAPPHLGSHKKSEIQSAISLAQIFGNNCPIELEIGCGKGKFLVARAEESPEINFLGIDRISKWMKIGQKRGDKRQLGNLKFIKAECRKFLSQMVPQSIAVFHIYFPDPWPKRRHRKRRLVTADFLRLLHSRLRRGGFVELATDDSDYFLGMKKAAGETANFWKNIREADQRLTGGAVKTNYELKFESSGRSLCYLELEKS